ncbi:MAG TPA: leucine-rich repeat-containing protein kinase family protein [Burkholderiaceae bacterium]|nr:leucine-rich repeat-containing protein kinase family protein [Burkholderiaceae bacterium]
MHTLEQLRSGALAGFTRLDLCAGLTALPPEVYGLADTLEVLNLSGNRLTDLPHDLTRFKKLKVVFGSDNAFTHLPEVLGDCPQLQMVGFKANRIAHVSAAALPPALRWLILTDNAVEQLPPELGQRPALQKLMLAGNRLTRLPDTLAAASQLELLRLSANRLQALPGWLTELPALAWLALSGNPAVAAPAQPGVAAARPGGVAAADTVLPVDTVLNLPNVPRVDWAQVAVGPRLGEGASGHIHHAQVAVGAAPVTDPATQALHGQPLHGQPLHGQPLALKLFKGAMTSDGLPHDELAASLAAGPHPALCTPVAQVVGHPQGLPGVLLPLIPPTHTVLAGPPSLASCTRDVYAPALRLSPAVAHTLARDVAQAVAHLHARGVMHGDLYAHNTLWHPATGHARLSDFGAATVLTQLPAATRQALLALEVRAFGIMLLELAERLDGAGGADAPSTPLRHLAQACMQADAGARPRMRDVEKMLHKT